MEFFAATDAGIVRKENEDSFYASGDEIGVLPNLFIVADGMGGHRAGGYASKTAVSSVCDSLSLSEGVTIKSAVIRAYEDANEDILSVSLSEQDKSGMGTTMVLCCVSSTLFVANIGDSRLYILKDGELLQITKDHTVVEEMLRMGSISREAARRHPKRHMLTRALGVEKHIEVDTFEIPVTGIEQILLATDGLYNMVSEDQILSILRSNDSTSDRAQRLIDTANKNGGDDNSTVLLIDMMR